MTHLTRTLVSTALALGLGVTGAFAQQASPAAPAVGSQASSAAASGQATARDDTAVIKPGDRSCIQDTGSRIRPKSGKCLPVTGRSYTGAELRRTGQIDTGRALQMLDPSIRIGQ